MKKFIVLCLFLGAFVINAQENTDFKKQTIDFIKKTVSQDTFINAVAQIGVSVPTDKKEAYVKEAKGTMNGLYSKMADLYMKEFTPAEITELNKFYNTALGKKLANKQFELSQKSMAIGQNWGIQVQKIAQKYAAGSSEVSVKK